MSHNTPYFSIIIPVYNVEKFIPRALDSVFDQTYHNWECICVDDGSSDSSSEILDNYAKRDSRLVVCHQMNLGVSAARNSGIKESRGAWIVFLDADDVLRSNYLQVAKDIINVNDGCDLVVQRIAKFAESDEPKWDEGWSIREVDVENCLPDKFICAPFFSYVYKRSIMPNHLFRPYSTGEDRLFLGECLVKVSKIAVAGNVGYGYRCRMGSAMNSAMSLRKLSDRVGYSKEWLDCLRYSGKTVSGSVWRLIINHLTESFVFDISRIKEDDRSKAWAIWYSALDWLERDMRCFSIWSKFVVFVCHKFHWHWLAWILCVMPFKVKRMGVHR